MNEKEFREEFKNALKRYKFIGVIVLVLVFAYSVWVQIFNYTNMLYRGIVVPVPFKIAEKTDLENGVIYRKEYSGTEEVQTVTSVKIELPAISEEEYLKLKEDTKGKGYAVHYAEVIKETSEAFYYLESPGPETYGMYVFGKDTGTVYYIETVNLNQESVKKLAEMIRIQK
jgi:hypothetical protein